MMTSISVTGTNRIIALVDMDCFYVQVEERDDPSIKGTPAAVVQYKAFKGGAIIAVNYEARAKGVSRYMRGDEAKAACPEVKLVRVPESRGKADLTKYRDAGREVINVLTDFSSCVERASIDEAYIDLTEAVEQRVSEISSDDAWSEKVVESLNMEYLATNFVLGCDSTDDWLESLKKTELPSTDNLKLAVGAEIVGKIRDAVYQRTSFRCSAGIAHNKVLAKLVCGINKPNKQTILPHESVSNLWSRTKIGSVRGLGGKLGEFVENLGCVYMNDLKKFTEKELNAAVGSKTGAWLYQLSLGFDDEAVTPRQLPKSIGCNKNFFGKETLKTKDKAKFWINQLASEVAERILRDLEINNRRAKTLTLHVKFENQNGLSRSCGIPHYNAERMAVDAYSVIEKIYQTVGVLPINSLGLIASKFEDEIDTAGCSKINDFFKSGGTSTAKSSTSSSTVSDVNSKNELKHTASNKQPAKINSDNGIPVSAMQPTRNVQMPGSSNGLCDVTPISSDGKLSPGHNVSDVGVKSVDSEEKNETCQTSRTVTNEDLRKPFFQFVESAPKPISPQKSPRKVVVNPVLSNKTERIPHEQLSETNASILKECERCGKRMAEWDLESHMDYHFAKDLSREINGLPPLNTHPETSKKNPDTEVAPKLTLKRPRGRGASSAGSKRGRGAKTTSASLPASNSRTIDSYFTPRS